MQYPVNDIVEELKIVQLVLELIPIDAELKKNLNLSAIALALKPRLWNIAHSIVANDSAHGINDNSYSKIIDRVARGDLQRLEETKLEAEWQPKFKVGDWVQLFERNNPLKLDSHDIFKILEIPSNSCGDYRLSKDNDFSSFVHSARGENLIQLWQPMQELKDQLVAMHEAFKSLYGSGLKVTDRIAKDDFKLKGLRVEHKWVELSEFVKNNPEWVNDNIEIILAQAELFRKKGDLIRYTHNKMNNNLIFEYKLGITKLMIPICLYVG